jgi:hypothetical protein
VGEEETKRTVAARPKGVQGQHATIQIQVQTATHIDDRILRLEYLDELYRPRHDSVPRERITGTLGLAAKLGETSKDPAEALADGLRVLGTDDLGDDGDAGERRSSVEKVREQGRFDAACKERQTR